MIGFLKRLFRRQWHPSSPPSVFHKTLAVHIAATTRSAGRKLWS